MHRHTDALLSKRRPSIMPRMLFFRSSYCHRSVFERISCCVPAFRWRLARFVCLNSFAIERSGLLPSFVGSGTHPGGYGGRA